MRRHKSESQEMDRLKAKDNSEESDETATIEQ